MLDRLEETVGGLVERTRLELQIEYARALLQRGEDQKKLSGETARELRSFIEGLAEDELDR